jgi:hypothetical protein
MLIILAKSGIVAFSRSTNRTATPCSPSAVRCVLNSLEARSTSCPDQRLPISAPMYVYEFCLHNKETITTSSSADDLLRLSCREKRCECRYLRGRVLGQRELCACDFKTYCSLFTDAGSVARRQQYAVFSNASTELCAISELVADPCYVGTSVCKSIQSRSACCRHISLSV